MKNWCAAPSYVFLVLGMIGFAAPVQGQETLPAPPSSFGVLSFGQQLEYDFDDGLQTRTRLGLKLSTATRSQSFQFSAFSEYQGDFRDNRKDDLFFGNTRAEIKYGVQHAATSLSLSASLQDLELEDGPFERQPGLFLINEVGTVTAADIAARLETGIERPFGITLDATFSDHNFSGMPNADLSDERILDMAALARFNLTQSLSLRAMAGVRQTDEDNLEQTETEATFFGLGLDTVSRRGLRFSTELLFDDTETTTNAPTIESNNGLGFLISLNKPQPNGLVGGEITSRIDEAGRRTSASLIRQLTLPTGGLSLSLGVLDQEGIDDLQFIGQVVYRRDMPRGSVLLRLEQAAATDAEDTVISTNLKINYEATINTTSSWRAGLGFLQADELLTNENVNETTASFSYQRDLASDWSMETGIELSRDDTGEEENKVFFNIQRDITFGF